MPIVKKRRNFEATFTTSLMAWLKHHAADIAAEYGRGNFGPIEAKVSYDSRFSLVAGFKKGQLEILTKVKEGTVTHKISDLGRINSRPWDIDCYSQSMAAVALMWHRTGNRVFYLLDPEVLLGLRERGTKSLTEPEAQHCAFKVGYLKK